MNRREFDLLLWQIINALLNLGIFVGVGMALWCLFWMLFALIMKTITHGTM
jgi:hypothetical protein